MGLFDRVFKKHKINSAFMKEKEYLKAKAHEKKAVDCSSGEIDGISLIEQYENGLIDDKLFLCSFAKVKVFYSTPFGDHKDGGQRLFLLPAEKETAYLPVFTSENRIKEFYKKARRRNFLIMEGSFSSFLETTKNINAGNTPIKLGVVIDPEYYGLTIGANVLDAVLDMIK